MPYLHYTCTMILRVSVTHPLTCLFPLNADLKSCQGIVCLEHFRILLQLLTGLNITSKEVTFP